MGAVIRWQYNRPISIKDQSRIESENDQPGSSQNETMLGSDRNGYSHTEPDPTTHGGCECARMKE